jgi:hypothetical protein
MDTNGPASGVNPQTDASIEHWKRLCAELTEERDRLHQELAELREKYKELRGKYEPVLDSLCILMGMDGEVDFEALRAQTGKVQSMEELLAELDAQYGTKGIP